MPPPIAQLGSEWVRPRDGMLMVYVPPPEAPFELESGVEAPADGYWIDKYEVSNAQFQLCVDAGECEPPTYGGDYRYNDDNYPAMGVSWSDAESYSLWVGGSLPTESQWEYAAVGNSKNDYPWGNEAISCLYANFGGCIGGLVEVDSYADSASWVGTLNMVGNVWEWTANWYEGFPGNARVLRGGSWDLYQSGLGRSFDYHPAKRVNSRGFRVILVLPSTVNPIDN